MAVEAHGRSNKLCYSIDADTMIKTAQAVCQSLDLGDAQSVTAGEEVHGDHLKVLSCSERFPTGVGGSYCTYRKVISRSCRQMRISCLKNSCYQPNNAIFATRYGRYG